MFVAAVDAKGVHTDIAMVAHDHGNLNVEEANAIVRKVIGERFIMGSRAEVPYSLVGMQHAKRRLRRQAPGIDVRQIR